jgi:sugar phosphate permease
VTVLTATNNTPRSLGLPIFIFALASFFYLYEFVLQVSPGVMTDTMMAEFAIDAAGVSSISAFYYYSYAPMQLPAGLLFDRFGARTIMTLAIIVCALGSIFFGTTHSVPMASVGRLLMGVGSAFSFIGVLVLLARWFDPKYFALLAGIAQLMSSVGAIAGETPLAIALDAYGRFHSMLFLGFVGFVLALMVWIFVKDSPNGISRPLHVSHKESEMARLLAVCRQPQTWYMAGYTFLVWSPIVVFAGLWGVHYIMQVLQGSKQDAANIVLWVWVGIGIGSPLGGWISDQIGRRRGPLMVFGLIGIISTAWIVFFPPNSFAGLATLMFFFGIAAGGQTLTFAVVKELNHAEHVGTASGLNNFATVLGGVVCQWPVGKLLVIFWEGEHTAAGLPIYTTLVFQKAFVFIPIFYVIAFLLVLIGTKETYCKSVYSD